jgi:SAM-dependent methyltransferase
MSADDPRTVSRERWERAAAGWESERETMQRSAQVVSVWLIEHIEPQPGYRLLELAAGVGDTGLLAAELVQPGGSVIITDGAEAMVEAAKRRAEQLGVRNVEIRQMEAEWIDLPAASVDGVLCRWGYMLLHDPPAALRETRRVLRPGGRVALAAWADPADNPWSAVPSAELRAMGALEPADFDAPGMFALRDPDRIGALLEDTGFTDIVIEQVDVVSHYADLDEWWDIQLDVSLSLADPVRALTPAQRDDLRDAIDAQLGAYVGPDGSVALPGRTHVAAASA